MTHVVENSYVIRGDPQNIFRFKCAYLKAYTNITITFKQILDMLYDENVLETACDEYAVSVRMLQ